MSNETPRIYRMDSRSSFEWQHDARLAHERFQQGEGLAAQLEHTIAEPHLVSGALATEDFGPALRRNGSDAELGKMYEIDQNEQCN